MDEAPLIAAVRYVAMNPVRARLVGRAVDWRWSSVGAHLAGADDGLAIGGSEAGPFGNRYAQATVAKVWGTVLGLHPYSYSRAAVLVGRQPGMTWLHAARFALARRHSAAALTLDQGRDGAA
jgi:hypothetical protein